MDKMKNLTEAISELVIQEYDRATVKFGAKHNGPHEAYAVILEEFEEAQYCIGCLEYEIAHFWGAVKKNKIDTCEGTPEEIKIAAIQAAAELIQVAAMAHKAQLGFMCDERAMKVKE